MLRIRPEQMKLFEDLALAEFDQGLVLHCRKHFADSCQEMGDEALLEHVHGLRVEAQAAGIERRVDICKYVNLGFVFGSDFAHEQDWAKRVLATPTLRSGATKVARLHEEAEKALSEPGSNSPSS